MEKDSAKKEEKVKILRKVVFGNNHLELSELREVEDYIDIDFDHERKCSHYRCDTHGCGTDLKYVSILRNGREFLRKNDDEGRKQLIGLLGKVLIALAKSRVTIDLTEEKYEFLNNYNIKLVIIDCKRRTVLVDGEFKKYIAKLMHLLFVFDSIDSIDYCDV